MPSEPDNSELEARLRELAPMVEAMHTTEGQLPPEKREQLLERIAGNALERRLKELAPMVEAVQATEGQLPPEKTELLLKQIAEGAAKRKLQARDEALWKELASAIARVPVALRKEWAKLPELLDKLPDPQSWLRAHLQTFDESAVSFGGWRKDIFEGGGRVSASVGGGYNRSAGAISPSAGGEYAINEAWEKAVYQKSEITRDTIRDGSPHLTKFLELCCLFLSAADGAFTDKKQEWVDAQFGEGAGDKFIENAQDLNLRAAIQDQFTPLSPNEIRLVETGLYIWAMSLLEVDGLDSGGTRPLNLLIRILEERGLRLSEKTRAEREAEEEAERPRLEKEAHQLYKEAEKEGVERSLRSLPPNTGALRDSLIMLPELLKNTPDARQRWEALLEIGEPSESSDSKLEEKIDLPIEHQEFVEAAFVKESVEAAFSGYHTDPASITMRCHDCSARFQPEDVKWVATHPSLKGDPILGQEAFLRFFPSGPCPEGVLDAKGSACTQTACPKCHQILQYESVATLTENPYAPA